MSAVTVLRIEQVEALTDPMVIAIHALSLAREPLREVPGGILPCTFRALYRRGLAHPVRGHVQIVWALTPSGVALARPTIEA